MNLKEKNTIAGQFLVETYVQAAGFSQNMLNFRSCQVDQFISPNCKQQKKQCQVLKQVSNTNKTPWF